MSEHPKLPRKFFARCVVCGRGYYQDDPTGECVGGTAIGPGCGMATMWVARPLVFRDKLGGEEVGVQRGQLALERKTELEARGWDFDPAPRLGPHGAEWWGNSPSSKRIRAEVERERARK